MSSVIFAYIDLLKSTPPAEWAFLEVAALSTLAFRFKEKLPPTSTAMHQSLTMSKPFPRGQLLSAPWLSTEWNPKIVDDLIQSLGPEKCRIMVASQEEIEGRTYDLKEQWYGTEHTIAPMSEKVLSVCFGRDGCLEGLGELTRFTDGTARGCVQVPWTAPARAQLVRSSQPRN